MDNLGIIGFSSFFNETIDRFSSLYTSSPSGFRRKVDGQPNYDINVDAPLADLINRIANFWKSLLYQIEEVIRSSGCSLESEKLHLLLEYIKVNSPSPKSGKK